jgi:hypothetical protein
MPEISMIALFQLYKFRDYLGHFFARRCLSVPESRPKLAASRHTNRCCSPGRI